MQGLRRRSGEAGQATVELLAALPVLLIAGLLVWQMCVVGIVLTSAQNAARTGARVQSRGGDGRMAAERALRASLRDGATITAAGDTVRVKVTIPAIVPGLNTPFALAETAAIPNTSF